MVRETRHLWVGNLPLSVREDRILDHFKRYGKVQSVKILPKKDEEGGGACATVAFIDIKSAAKAHNADNKIDERTLKTDYYEPPASSTAASAIFIHERDDALVVRNPAPPPPPTAYATSRNTRYGLPEDRNYGPGHYYERVNEREPYLRRPVGMGYHDEDSYQGRAKSRDRYVRSASGNTYTEGTERGQNHFRAHNARQIFEQTRYAEQYNDERDVGSTTPRLNRRTNNASTASVISSVASPPPARSESRPRRSKRRSPSQSPSASRSNSESRSRSRSSSGSRSSSSSSKLRSSSSDSSGRSWSPAKSRSPVTPYGNQSNSKRLDRPTSAITNPSSMTSYLPSAISGSAVNCTLSVTNSLCPAPNQSSSGSSSSTVPPLIDGIIEKEEKKPLGICVRNLPVRSTDTSLKDGLFHEYKKHGKVTMVKVIGQGIDRYAVVCFKKPEDVEKALEVSKDKQFFGCKIEVTAHEGLDANDNESRPLEAELDEYHPKATRTLFIGNLEKDITTAELRKHFDQFGEIIEIDIKKQGSATSYAFIQYSDIASVVKAMRKLDGENLGANRIKLGFGKSMPTNCVWLDGIVDAISEKYLARHFSRFGLVAYCAVDWEKGHALIFYDSMEFAQIAVAEMRGRILNGKKLQVDFASRECQTTFFDKLEMSGQMVSGDRPWERRERRGTEFDIVRGDDRDTRTGFDRVYARYDGQARTNRGNFRGVQRTGFCSRGRGQNFANRYEVFHDEFGERRHRYNAREESGESSSFDGKVERLKYGESLDCNNRKWNKLRNSISDQESHHSQSPPHSRHQSRSTSPVSKERKSLKDRLHHRIKSPGSHNSSQLNSPCREPATDDLPEADFKEFRVKNCEGKSELVESDIILPLASPKNMLLQDGMDKMNAKLDNDLLLRRSVESESLDENSASSEQLSQLERKKRLLAATTTLNKDGGIVMKMSSDRVKLKNSTSHSMTNKFIQSNCIPDCITDEKSDVESGEVNDENEKEKLRSGDSANTDLRYLQKKQVHILQLLDQLRDGVSNSSDVEGSVENEHYLQKKKRSLSSGMENLYSENEISKAVTKDESNSRLLKGGLKDQISLSKNVNKSDSVDSNNCFSVSLDSFVFRKHLDPRKVDQYTLNSLPKCRRISVDKDDLLPNNHSSGDSFMCAPSNAVCDVLWKKHSRETLFLNNESDDVLQQQHPAKHEINDSCISNQKLISAPDLVKTGRPFLDSSLEIKRERDISPLSLPLPQFAATLRSPKSSPCTMTSPKNVAQAPHVLHSPNPYGGSKIAKIPDIPIDVHHDRKSRDMGVEEKVNGVNVSSATNSPAEFHLPAEVSDAIYLETIQSPKNISERSKETVLSSDSDLSPISSPSRPSIEDRIKALDEKFNAWSGCTRAAGSVVAEASPATVIDLPKCGLKRSRFNFLATDVRTEPSDIVKSLLSKSTIFDQDSMRLQHIDEKYEPLNVKAANVSPKVKPTFRTKAAAKEFSSLIVPPPLQTMSAAVQSSALGVSSPPHTSQSAMTNAVLSPVTPLMPHFSQVPSQLYTSCSPYVGSFPSRESEDNNSFTAIQNICGDQAGLVPYTTLKLKPEPDMVPSLELVPHGLLNESVPLNVKKEPDQKSNVQPPADEVEEEKLNHKKDVPLSQTLSSTRGKDFMTLKDQELCRGEGMNELNRKMIERSFDDFHDKCSHWKESDAAEEAADVSKASPNLDSSDIKLVAPAAKKRVSSLDSSESESGKSCRSLETIRECRDVTWSKHEREKQESKSVEPECKKSKLSYPQNVRNRSPTPVPISSYKKSEKKEKSSKCEKSRSSNPKKVPSSSNSEKEESDVKLTKSESKDKCKNDNHRVKEDKKSKIREHKERTKDESARGDEKNKSYEKQNVDKNIKPSCSRSVKTKKDSSGSRPEKTKSDKKSGDKKTSKSKTKQEFELPFDEEPVYFSMYDKVKARSSKQQTMKHQAKDLETMRQKFSKLKQSRAKREEKSKSIDSDKDTDSGSQHSSDSDAKTSKAKQQRKRKLVIESSSDDEFPSHSQNRNSKHESKDLSDFASDSDFDQKSIQKHSISRSRKKKADVIESDSSDSGFHVHSHKSDLNGKKKFKSRSSQEKTKKTVKSEEGEISDVALTDKFQVREKDHKRKKVKKAKNHDRTLERESVNKSSNKKICDEGKTSSRKVLHKDESQHSDNSVATKSEVTSRDKSENLNREKKAEHSPEAMDIDDSEAFKSFNRKKKKSKKTTKCKEKRVVSDKRSSEFTSRKDDESESKSSLPVLLSPRPSSPTNDKPLSPPCLKAGDMSENDIKSDLSDKECDVDDTKGREVYLSDIKNYDVKTGNASICNSKKESAKKKESFLKESVHSKLHAELFDSRNSHALSAFSDKGSKVLLEKELCNKGSSKSVDSSSSKKRMLQSSAVRKGKELAFEHFHKTKHEIIEESNLNTKHSVCKTVAADGCLSKEKRRRKLKKPLRDKKWKPKSEEMKEDHLQDNCGSMQPTSPLIFETVSFDDSHLSDIRLDEEIAKEARRLEQELLAVSEETSTFGDEGPTVKKEDKLPERKFEEEAAKETKRLEAELFSTGRDSWHMKEKSFETETHVEDLCSDSKEAERTTNCLVMKEESIFTSLALHSSSLGDVSQHENDMFLSSHSNSDQYKLEDKDAVSEIDDQRKIEDDLAVSALLQEMNSGDISAPELTKETDYLEPLINSQPEDTMNYLLPDEGDNSLHIVDQSPELLVNENSNAKLDNDDIALSPSSNLEPPPLEISNFEDSLTTKHYQNGKSVLTQLAKSEDVAELTSKNAVENMQMMNLECSSGPLTRTTECTNPPVIDIPSGTATLQAVSDSISPKIGKRFERKRWLEHSSPEIPLKDVAFPPSPVDPELPNTELQENSPGDFEDITMDTKDSKDDDNPPILLPVDLQPRLEITAESLNIAVVSKSNESVSDALCSDSVIVHTLEAKKDEEKNQMEDEKNEQDVTLSLSELDNTCGNSVPVSSATFCADVSEESDFRSPQGSKDGNVEPDDSHLSLESAPPESDSPSQKNPDLELKDTDVPLQKLSDEVPVKTSSNSLLYYPDPFHHSEAFTSNKYDKKCDTSVIKSTANVMADNLSFDLSEKSSSISSHSEIISETSLRGVLSPSKDGRGGVIFNTSELAKDSCDVTGDISSNDHNNDHTCDKDKLSQSQETVPVDVTDSSTDKDPFDTLHETPKPPALHFPPLFTIPTTEPLLSPCGDRPPSVAEDSILSTTESETVQEEKEEDNSVTVSEEQNPASEAVQLEQQEEPESVVSLAETLLKIDENLEGGDSLGGKSRGADVESVSSDTTDITFPDIKGDFEINQVMSSEEQVKDEVCAVEESVVVPEMQKSERPRRGRRPKTRKFATTSSNPNNSSTAVKNRRVRTVSFERTRRSLRSDTAEQSVILETIRQDRSPDNRKLTVSLAEQETDINKSIKEIKQVESVVTLNRIELSTSQEMLESKSTEKVYNTRSEETKRRRGRRKKISAEHQSSNAHEKPDGETDHCKEFHRPKESRLWISQSSEKEQRGAKENSSKFDIFEFHGSDDEEVNFNRDLQSSVKERLQSSVKERLHDNSRNIGSNQEPKPDSKVFEPPPEKEEKSDAQAKIPTNDDGETSVKECVTEVSQQRKISITIRLHQKEGHDGTSTGTAEVVKTSVAVASDDVKSELKPEKIKETKDSVSSDSSHSGPSKCTRKSTRLMNQAARSNVDEIIEEVVKGNFKSSHNLESAPSRVTRRSRANRKSEEIAYMDMFEDPTEDKNKNEPMFVILDNTVKDAPESKKSHTIDVPPMSEGSCTAEHDRNGRVASMRSFRINRFTASKLDSQKENSVSEVTHDADLRKKEPSVFSPPEEKKEVSSVDQQTKKESSILLPDAVPYRPPLPVLKVELPRMVLSCGKEPVVHKNDGMEDNEDDRDSRSSPAVLIDPVTGFLAPVCDNSEMLEKHDSSTNSGLNADAKHSAHSTSYVSPAPAVTVASVKLGIKDIKLSKEDKSGTLERTSYDRPSSVSVLSGPLVTATPTAGMKKEVAPHIVPDLLLPASDMHSHPIDLKSTSTHVSVLTSVVVTSAPCHDATKTVSVSASTQSSSQCPSASSFVQSSQARVTSNSSALRLSVAGTQGIVPATGNQVVVSASTSGHVSTSSSPHQPLTRTVVTALVTVASSESVASHPSTVQAKCLPSSSSLQLSHSTATKPEIAPIRVSVMAPSITDTGSTPCTKGSNPHSLNGTPHWSSTGVKYISSASSAASSNSTSWSSSKLASQTSSALSEKPTNLSAIPASSYQLPTVGKSDSRINQAVHPHSSKNSAAYFQQLGYHTPMYEAANLSASNSGGVIAELLQNPQLLQHKEYHAGTAGSAGQFQDRNQSQIIRPSTPGSAGIPPDVAARLGNPTPPHTPTPLVSTSTHSLQQSTDIHNAHMAAGLHLRQMPYALGIPSWEMSPYVHNSQIIYAAAAHPHYAAMHPEFRAQQEVQARASMGISPCLAYPTVPPGSTVSPGNFRQPLEPRLAHSSEHKPEGKSNSDVSEPPLERRVPYDKNPHGMKSSRMKKDDIESKIVHCEDYERPGSAPQSSRLRQEYVHYTPAIRQDERKTDSPVITKYATGQVRSLISVPDQLKDPKQDGSVSLPHSLLVKADSTERELNPPAAHQAHVSTSYHTFESAAFPGVRQQLLGIPQVPSPTSVFDGRSASQPGHTASTYPYKKNSHLAQNMSSSEKLIYEEVSKKLLERPLGHQGTSVSPGLGTAQVIQSLNPHPLNQPAHCVMPQNGQMDRRPNAHALVMTPPLAPQGTNNDAEVVNKHPIVWQGMLALKNDEALVQMHVVSGNKDIARESLPPRMNDVTPTLRISQRMKLDETQLQGVQWKMMNETEHCILIALPCGTTHSDVLKQSSKLKSGFITYLKQKQAAGIVNIGNGTQQPAFVVHVFPPACEFSKSTLNSKAPFLATVISDLTHLVIIITTA